MDMKYLLDTNVLSEPTKPDPSAALLKRLSDHRSEVCTASTVLHELWFGLLLLPKGKRRTQLEMYMDKSVSQLPVLPYDDRAARYHAEERVRLQKIGRKQADTKYADGIIAAVAVVNNLIVVTANMKHFKVFRGLRVENWA